MLAYCSRDRVEWDADQERQAEQAVELNSAVVLPDDKIVEYEQKADHFWDSFYMQHQNRSVHFTKISPVCYLRSDLNCTHIQ